MIFSRWISISEYDPPIGKNIEIMYRHPIHNSDCYTYMTANATRIKRYLRTKVFEDYWISNDIDTSSNEIKHVSYWRYISE